MSLQKTQILRNLRESWFPSARAPNDKQMMCRFLNISGERTNQHMVPVKTLSFNRRFNFSIDFSA